MYEGTLFVCINSLKDASSTLVASFGVKKKINFNIRFII